MAEIIDPYVHELLRDLRELTNRQFIYEDPWHGFVPYDGAPTEYQLGPPVPFAALDRRDKADVLEFISWDHYREKGLDWRDQNAIENNVIEGKPREQWLDGTSLDNQGREKSLSELKDHGKSGNRTSDAEWEAFVELMMKDGFNWPAKPDELTRPGPEETPLQRAERQIGHIKVLPDPFDFGIEELGPWDTAVSAEWKRLPEMEKLFRLIEQVDWCDISTEDKRRLLEREVGVAQLPPEIQQQLASAFQQSVEEFTGTRPKNGYRQMLAEAASAAPKRGKDKDIER